MKRHRWVVRFMDNHGTVHIFDGYESKESSAIQKLFSVLQDKKFTLSVLDASTYMEGGNGSVIHVNPISKKVIR